MNSIYACSVKLGSSGECKIILRDLLSARGLFLDAYHRYLYVVDHKKRVIKRTRLLTVDDILGGDSEELTPSTILSTDLVPDLGDIFYMTVHAKGGQNTLIWSEFSGKIRMSGLNDTAHSKVIFSTHEYTYSVNVMDNATQYSNYYQSTIMKTTLISSTTTTTNVNEEEAVVPEISSTTDEETTTTMTTTEEEKAKEDEEAITTTTTTTTTTTSFTTTIEEEATTTLPTTETTSTTATSPTTTSTESSTTTSEEIGN